jgi:hypothetical protein
MLQRKSHSTPKPASDDDVVTRALDLIGTKLERTDEAQLRVVDAIAKIARTSEHAPRWNSREVREARRLAGALRTAMAALKTHLARGVFHRSELTADQLREELAAFAAAAEWQYSTRRGPGGNHKKFMAALEAHELLRRHGVEPTLYKSGALFQLAAMLYEGATGIATDNEDLSRQCKRVVHRFRQFRQ